MLTRFIAKILKFFNFKIFTDCDGSWPVNNEILEILF